MKTGPQPYPSRISYINQYEIEECIANLYLVRHPDSGPSLSCDTDWRRDWNENGIEQANALSVFFKDKSIDIVISSGIWRADRLAKILAKESQTKMIQVPRLGFADDKKDGIEVMFQSHGQTALRKWTRDRLWGYMHGIGFLMLDALMEAVEKHRPFAVPGGFNVVVIGHAVNHAAIVHALGQLYRSAALTKMGLHGFIKGGDTFHIRFHAERKPTVHIIRCSVRRS